MKRKEILIQALNDSDEAVRIAASKAMEQLEIKYDIEEIGSIVLKGDKLEKLRAVYALGEARHSKRALAYIVKATKDPVEDVRSAAVRVLGELRDARTIKAILERIGDNKKTVKLAAIEAIGEYRDRRVVPTLIVQLGSDDKDVVVKTVEALGKIGDKSAEAKLIGMANSKDADIRREVLKTLGELEV